MDKKGEGWDNNPTGCSQKAAAVFQAGRLSGLVVACDVHWVVTET